MEVQVLSMIYGDGLKKFTDFVGSPTFHKSV
jgi:hypothetical protein